MTYYENPHQFPPNQSSPHKTKGNTAHHQVRLNDKSSASQENFTIIPPDHKISKSKTSRYTLRALCLGHVNSTDNVQAHTHSRAKEHTQSQYHNAPTTSYKTECNVVYPHPTKTQPNSKTT